MDMNDDHTDSDPGMASDGDVESIHGIIEWETLEHLLDVELARARRYEHPFALLRLRVSDAARGARLRAAAGALRLHTRWADSVGVTTDGALLVILRDTPADGARAAVDKIAESLREELGEAARAFELSFTTWRKGDDRARLLARLG